MLGWVLKNHKEILSFIVKNKHTKTLITLLINLFAPYIKRLARRSTTGNRLLNYLNTIKQQHNPELFGIINLSTAKVVWSDTDLPQQFATSLSKTNPVVALQEYQTAEGLYIPKVWKYDNDEGLRAALQSIGITNFYAIPTKHPNTALVLGFVIGHEVLLDIKDFKAIQDQLSKFNIKHTNK